MNAIASRPQTNLPCQHGISIAQRGWMYENMGYSASAMTIYQQAIRTLSRGIDQMEDSAPDDALFYLGASQMRLGSMNWRMGNLPAGRQCIQDAIANLEAAWQCRPSNLWYQQALAQASMMLSENDEANHDAWELTNDLFAVSPV